MEQGEEDAHVALRCHPQLDVGEVLERALNFGDAADEAYHPEGGLGQVESEPKTFWSSWEKEMTGATLGLTGLEMV